MVRFVAIWPLTVDAPRYSAVSGRLTPDGGLLALEFLRIGNSHSNETT